jgi:peptidoglycan/LPS O-acetylase OafA/YrhL
MGEAAIPTHRIKGLDGLRGVAAMSVLLFHYTVVYGLLIEPLGPLPFVAPYGRHGVELFFIISGFVILMTVENSRSVTDFAVSRFARLFPVFWTAVLIESLALALIPLPPTFPFPTISSVAENFTMMPVLFHARFIDGSYWSLFLELVFYVLMATAFRFRLTDKIELLCFAWLIVFAIVRLYHPELGSRTRYILLVEYGHFFIIGICLYRIWAARSSKLTFVLLASACGMSLFGPGPDSGSVSTPTYFLITLGCTALVWLAAADKLSFLTLRPLQLLGAISYPVYLFHMVIGFELIRLVHSAGASPTIALVMGTAGTILLAIAVNKLIERPARHLIRERYGHYRNRISPMSSAPVSADAPGPEAIWPFSSATGVKRPSVWQIAPA